MIFELVAKFFIKSITYKEFHRGLHLCVFSKIVKFTQHSTGPSLGNLVDSLPGALHTKALGAPMGGSASGYRGADQEKDRKCLKQ